MMISMIFNTLALLAASVLGHATINPPVASSAYAAFIIRIPHGCNSTSTLDVTVQIPKGVTSVKPKKIYGWRLSTTSRNLDTPITAENGAQITSELDTITWSDGNLPDSEFEEFPLTVKLPFPASDGTKFYFPTIQRCVTGSNNWTQVPTPGVSLQFPAPALTVMANNTLVQFNASWAQVQMQSIKTNAANGYPVGLAAASSIFLMMAL
ncbi:hypothetical protein HDV01_004029 [Terramyces sp. JEL0728]|nr:hypothetical protein HDV01_004029 [Terramyces sp. JEL0728]